MLTLSVGVAFTSWIDPAFTTVMMARPLASWRTLWGMLLSGMPRNARMMLAQRLTLPCSDAWTAALQKKARIRISENFFMKV